LVGQRLKRWLVSAQSFVPRLPTAAGRQGDHVPGPGEGIAFTVVAGNLARTPKEEDAQADALMGIDADVICLTEHVPTTSAALQRATERLGRRWEHESEDVEGGYFGSLVASRHPIVGRQLLDLGGRPGHIVDLAVADLVVRVVPVHTQAPIFDHDLDPWHTNISAVAAVAADSPGPVILAGDWNATGGHPHFRRVLADHGLVDAHSALRQRWAPTWPVVGPRRFRLPAVLALDHVVVSPDVAVGSLERLRLPGTDHLALRAELRLPG
jgi:endonuclease/exonuclease/phosphatase family metal-dependent hydrolase